MNSLNLFNLLIVLSLQINKIKAEILEKNLLMKHSMECATILESFASASAHFMFCTLQNSRPVHICCSCSEEYNEVLKRHNDIAEANHNQNSTCNESLINQDRLEVIESGFLYIKQLWLKGQCENCFDKRSSPSNITKEFIKLYSNTNQCLENHYNSTKKTYNKNVCQLCSEVYYKMSKFYAQLKETSGNGNVCIDIVDTVNVTQHLWSNVLHCGETVMTLEIPLILLSSIFFILPFIFYISAWKFTRARTTDVLNQNRVSQRFKQRSRSQTGSLISN